MNALAPHRRGLVLLGVGVLAALSSAARAADPLVWKLEPGLTNRYEMTQKMDMKMNVGGGAETSVGVEQTINFSWTVDSIKDDGAAVLKQKIDRMQMTITANDGQKSQIDSASDKPPEGQAAQLAPLLKEFTSSAFTVTMNPRGEILEVEVPESLVKALQGIPGAAVMGDLTTAEGFKKLVKQTSFTIPETLEPGAQWTATAETKNPAIGTQVIETTYKYEGPREVDGKTMEVFTPTLVMKYEAGDGGTKIEVVGQESSGEILFNRDDGRLESSKIEQGMDLKFNAQGHDATQKLDQVVETKWMPEEK